MPYQYSSTYYSSTHLYSSTGIIAMLFIFGCFYQYGHMAIFGSTTLLSILTQYSTGDIHFERVHRNKSPTVIRWASWIPVIPGPCDGG